MDEKDACKYYFTKSTKLPVGWLVGRNLPRSDLNSESEIEYFLKLLKNGEWVMVRGPRLVGKTTFVKSVTQAHFNSIVYVNVMGLNTFQEFVLKTYEAVPHKTRVKARQEFSTGALEIGVSSLKGIHFKTSKQEESPTKLKSYDIFLDILLKHLPRGSVIIWDEVQALGVKNILKLLNSLWRVYHEIDDEEARPRVVVTGSSVRVAEYFTNPSKYLKYDEAPFAGREFSEVFLSRWDKQTFMNYMTNGAKCYGHDISYWELEFLWKYSGGLPGVASKYGRARFILNMSPDNAKKHLRSQLERIRQEIFNLIDLEFPNAASRLKKALHLFAQGAKTKDILSKAKTSHPTFYSLLNTLEAAGYLFKTPKTSVDDKEYEFIADIYRDAILLRRPL